MSAAPAIVSIGDEGVLNTHVSPSLSEVWIDRDLSWLDFNERVLAEAMDERTPLLERAKFLAIFTANLDEFFMKRIAVLRETLTPERLKLLGADSGKTAAHARSSRPSAFGAASCRRWPSTVSICAAGTI